MPRVQGLGKMLHVPGNVRYSGTLVSSVVPFLEPSEHANVPKCTALLHCTGNVPHKFVAVHIPVPVSASLTHLK